ncbi:glycosyltransferase family 2 protein [Treponema primitia]|uniref:glycosyltransferase family 2 protein n=1 Tax=Treponema primitia TaxID=88058 RepID=UPI000255556A|nr:glycosyltransferase [Treponema primitia]
MPLLSIIVPVYKTEKYLHKCVDSILAQTFTDFECILIDDGSPDTCREICDGYALKDCRIIVIHQKNAGVSAARNAGLDIARGEWIGFVDSDDWCDSGMFEFLINNAKKYNADISICGANKFRENGKFYYYMSKKYPDIIMSGNEAILKMFSATYFSTTPWNKLVNKKCFYYNNTVIRYDESILFLEDGLILYFLFKNSEKIVYSSIPYYNYLFRSDSVTQIPYKSGIADSVLTNFIAFKKMLAVETDSIVRHKLMAAEGSKAVNYCLFHIKNNLSTNNDNFIFLKEIIRKDILFIITDKTIGNKRKIFSFLIFFPFIISNYYKIKRCLKKV